MDKEMFATEVMSYTHNRKNHVVVSKKYLKPGEHILIMDDFSCQRLRRERAS